MVVVVCLELRGDWRMDGSISVTYLWCVVVFFHTLGFPGLDQGELLQLMEWLDYYNQEVGE